MPSPVFGIGSAPNDNTGDKIRDAFQKLNRLPLWDGFLNPGSGDYTGTNEQKITNCIADAVVAGKNVWIPKSFQPFNGASVTFNAAVLMMGEGGPHDGSMWLRAYGVSETGLTDVTTVLQTVENLRPAWTTLKAVPGVTYVVNTAYDGSQGARINLLKAKVAGHWDFSGATLKYGSSSQLTTGSDGLGLGVVNSLSSDFKFTGIVDCNSLARYAFALSHLTKRTEFNATFLSTLETSGVWNGIKYAVSVDVTGVTVSPSSDRAKGIYGFLKRPSCPIIDSTGTIIQHSDCTATLVGDDTVVGDCTGLALVLNNQIAPGMPVQHMDSLGVVAFGFPGIGNTYLCDMFVHDLNVNTIEMFGTSQANSDAFKVPQLKRIGLCTKGAPGIAGVGSGWWFNDPSGNPDGPNVWIDGGNQQSNGLIDLSPLNQAGGFSSTQGGRLVHHVVDLSDAGTIVVDSSKGDVFRVTLGGNRTMGAPSLTRKGQIYTFIIVQDGTGGRTLLWNAIYHHAWSDTGNTLNKFSTICFVADETGQLRQMGAQSPYIT